MKIAILFGAVLALLAANIYLFYQVKQIDTELGKTRDALSAEISKMKETSSVSVQSNRRTVDSLKDQLERAQRLVSSAAGQARVDASKHADDLAAKLAAEQVKQQAALHQEISKVADDTSKANTQIASVSTEVGTVKTDVANTKSELEKTISDLKRTTGDLGVQSGLIATNGKELTALRALGERNYYDFKLLKTKAPQKVGDISVLLKKVDSKKNRYTIEVLADDKTVEKRDRSVNEPIQFYVSKARQPYEIVVNSVGKDQIAGYLATPKVQQVRN